MDVNTETTDTLDVSIEKMVYGGDGLARTPQGVVLIAGVIPGERASVRLEERRRGVRRGQVLELAETSPDRIAAGCPYFGRCGGCHYQHISYARQLELKQEILAECLERVGKIRLDVPISVAASEPWEYRNRARLQIEKQGSEFAIGYYELFSHRLCPVERCPISSPAINTVIAVLRQGVGAACFPDGHAELDLFASDGDRAAMLATIESPVAAPPGFGEKLRAAVPFLESVCWREQPARRETVWGSGAVTYRVGEFHYRVSHDAFFQANRFLHEGMIQAVTQDLAGAHALDLYAGVGFFTIPLARRFEKVAAVEAHGPSAQNLAANVGVVGLRARVYPKPVEKFLTTASHHWDLVLVNPPRSGLTPIVVEHLRRVRSRRLVYVSCDPTTLARDLAHLTPSPYQIRSVQLVDQFPQTFHIETVAHLEQAG